jgi:hypothetical protein
MTEETRDRSAMEGLIAKADVILRCALDPDRMGLPKDLCEQCKGILILSVIEAGFIVTVNVGCGILLAKRSDGTWSGPSAVEVTGIGTSFARLRFSSTWLKKARFSLLNSTTRMGICWWRIDQRYCYLSYGPRNFESSR